MNSLSLSVLIVTRNRPKDIERLLRSLVQSSYRNFSVYIADQSTDTRTTNIIRDFRGLTIRYFRLPYKGKSKGLNYVLKETKDEILVFTDDDCIVSNHWLSRIVRRFKQTPKLDVVFGSTYPYKPYRHHGQFCPSTLVTKKFRVHHFQKLDYHRIGLGNNMAIRRSALMKYGGFKNWLGPGSISENGEECEIVFRLLKHGAIVATDPSIIAYHNRWLSYTEHRLVNIRYGQGFLTFLSHYLLTPDYRMVIRLMRTEIEERTVKAFREYKQAAFRSKRETYYLFLEVMAVIKGISVGLFSIFLG